MRSNMIYSKQVSGFFVMAKYFLTLLVGLTAFLFPSLGHSQSFSAQNIQNMEESHDSTRWWVDVNADGRDDFCFVREWDVDMLRCYLSTGTGFSPTPLEIGQVTSAQHQDHTLSQSPIYWKDVNGDGYPDYCRRANQSVVWTCNFGPSFQTATSFTFQHFEYEIECTRPGSSQCQNGNKITVRVFPHYSHVFMEDVNADGRSDVCYIVSTQSQTHSIIEIGSALFYCHLAGDGGYSGIPSLLSDIAHYGKKEFPRGFVDFNGDGYPDFCRILADGRNICLMGSPSGFSHEITTDAVSIPFKEGAQYVDFNGDGKTDICRIGAASSSQPCMRCAPVTHTYDLQCRLSNGVNWDPVERKSAVIPDVGDAQMRWWIDINADGIADFCRGEGGELRCQLGRGDADASGSSFSHDPVVHTVGNWGLAGGRSFCDAAGSGIPTLCRATLDQQTHQNCGQDGCFPYVVTDGGALVGFSTSVVASPSVIESLNPGIGMETRITYAPMTDPEVYQRSGMGTYPRSLIRQSPQSVVKETRAWETGGGSIAHTRTLTGIARYFYKDLRNDAWDGSRGFRERSMYTEGSNIVDRTVFFQGLGPTVDATSRLNDMFEVGQVKSRSKMLYRGASTSGAGRQAFITSLLTQTTGIGDGPVPGNFQVLSNTVNELADTVADDGSSTSTPNPRHRYIGKSVTSGVDLNGAVLPSAQSENRQDRFGNVVSMAETTTAPNGLTWSKTTTNDFGTDTAKRRLGRLMRSTVASTAPSVDAQMAAHSRSAGASPGAADTGSPATPTAPQPIRPEVLMSILQLLLED